MYAMNFRKSYAIIIRYYYETRIDKNVIRTSNLAYAQYFLSAVFLLTLSRIELNIKQNSRSNEQHMKETAMVNDSLIIDESLTFVIFNRNIIYILDRQND